MAHWGGSMGMSEARGESIAGNFDGSLNQLLLSYSFWKYFGLGPSVH